MRRTFHTITDDNTKYAVAENVVYREREVAAYYMNIDNYEALLLTLPTDDWPEELVKYRGKSADKIPDEHDEVCNLLNYRDRVRFLLRTEKQECAKAEAILDVLIGRIMENERAEAIQSALDRITLRELQG